MRGRRMFRVVLPGAGLLGAILLIAWPAPAQQAMANAGAGTARAGWSFSLSTDRPLYRGGDSAAVRLELANRSPDEVWGYSPSRGGAPCEWRFHVEDAQGRTVWTDGPAYCPAVLRFLELGPGAVVRRSGSLELVYRNAGGIGPEGQPLEPGFYRVVAELEVNGPLVGNGFGGLNPTAAVPLQLIQ